MENVSIVILNYNSWKATVDEIDLISKILRFDVKDIVVVDNCSTDSSRQELAVWQKKYGFKLLLSDRNDGYAAGNNIGLRYSYENGYKYAWIMNNDIIFSDENILKKMIKIIANDKSIAIVSPDVYSPKGYLYNRYSKRPSFWDFTLGSFAYKKNARKVEDKGGYGIVYRPQGCCMLVDLVVMNEICYMDEKTFLYGEESILAERLLKAGYVSACAINTSIIHNHAQVVRNEIQKKRLNTIKKESNVYLLKNYRKFNSLQIAIVNVFLELKYALSEGK